MKAVRIHEFGGVNVLTHEEIFTTEMVNPYFRISDEKIVMNSQCISMIDQSDIHPKVLLFGTAEKRNPVPNEDGRPISDPKAWLMDFNKSHFG